jgi:hypothetical protein
MREEAEAARIELEAARHRHGFDGERVDVVTEKDEKLFALLAERAKAAEAAAAAVEVEGEVAAPAAEAGTAAPADLD